jgi:hypothetical protein
MAGEVFGESSIDGVPERFLNTGKLRRNLRSGAPQDTFGQRDILGIRAVAIDTKDSVLLADMRLPGSALKTRTTRNVRFGCDIIADLHQRYFTSRLHHMAA